MMPSTNRFWVNVLIALVLVAAMIAARCWIDTPNFKPIAAICLWSLLLFSRWTWALAVPAIGMLISDFYLGFSPVEIAIPVYCSLAVVVALGWWGRQAIVSVDRSLSGRLAILLAVSLLCGLQFFVVTNFAVWSLAGWYPMTWVGLQSCFVQALPFYRWTVASDLLFGFAPAATWLVAVSAIARINVARISAIANR